MIFPQKPCSWALALFEQVHWKWFNDDFWLNQRSHSYNLSILPNPQEMNP